jgi:hypothetical protein
MHGRTRMKNDRPEMRERLTAFRVAATSSARSVGAQTDDQNSVHLLTLITLLGSWMETVVKQIPYIATGVL